MKGLVPLLIGIAAALVDPAEAAPAARAAAEALIERGVRLREKGQDAAALREFQRSHELSPSPRALAQIALAEQALGRWIEAEAHLGEALAAERDPWIRKNRRALEGARSRIAQHLGRLGVAGGPAGAEVRVDGRPAGRLPLAAPIRVPVGTVSLEVSALGFVPVRRTVTIAPEALAREGVELVAETAPAASLAADAPLPLTVDRPAPPPPLVFELAPSASGARPLGWIAAAAAGLALGMGVTFHAVHQARVTAFNDDPTCGEEAPMSGGPRCAARLDGIRTALGLAIAGYVGAAALGGLSAYLLLAREEPARGLSLRCAPAGAGLTCAGAF